MNTKTYSDGTVVSGGGPFPELSPAQQDARDNYEAAYAAGFKAGAAFVAPVSAEHALVEALVMAPIRPPTLPALVAALEEALEFVENQEDITDGPDGQPQPNNAMLLAQVLRAALGKA